MAKDKEEKPKMSKGKKIVAGLLVALTIAGAAVGAAIAITNSLNNTQGNIGPGTSFTPGQEEPGQIPGGDVNDPVIDQGGDNGGAPVIPGGGNENPVDPPAVEYTEAEYKEMFEADILTAIQNDYNKDITMEKYQIKDLELELINYETGDIYFTCKRNNQKLMFIANHEEVAEWATYAALYENMPETFDYSSAITVQEDGLAEEIVEFALTQSAIQTYAAENNLDLSDYTVINVTEFKGTTKGAESDVVLLTEDGILTFTLVGSTGYCSTQEEYLTKMKYYDDNSISSIKLLKHYEIPTGSAESAADFGFEF